MSDSHMNLPRYLIRKLTGITRPASKVRMPHTGEKVESVLSRLHHDDERRGAVGYSYALGAIFNQLQPSPLREGHRVTWFDLGSTGTLPHWRAAMCIASTHVGHPIELHIVRQGTGTPYSSTFDSLSTAQVFDGNPLSYLDAYGLPDMALFDASFVRILREQPQARELVALLVEDGVRLAGIVEAPEQRPGFRNALIEAGGGNNKLDVRDRSVIFWDAQPSVRLRVNRAA